jgi:multiple sugar transport system substrate-binding protein
VSVGGQGVSISSYSRHKDETWKFLEWFLAEKQQWRWVEGGGKTGRASILADPRFVEATPYNESFVASMRMTRDYWHLPEYVPLLEVYQRDVHRAVTGKMAPGDALRHCAEEQEAILRSAEKAGR